MPLSVPLSYAFANCHCTAKFEQSHANAISLGEQCVKHLDLTARRAFSLCQHSKAFTSLKNDSGERLDISIKFIQINGLCARSAMWDDKLLGISIWFWKAWISDEDIWMVITSVFLLIEIPQDKFLVSEMLTKSWTTRTEGGNRIVWEIVCFVVQL